MQRVFFLFVLGVGGSWTGGCMRGWVGEEGGGIREQGLPGSARTNLDWNVVGDGSRSRDARQSRS